MWNVNTQSSEIRVIPICPHRAALYGFMGSATTLYSLRNTCLRAKSSLSLAMLHIRDITFLLSFSSSALYPIQRIMHSLGTGVHDIELVGDCFASCIIHIQDPSRYSTIWDPIGLDIIYYLSATY